MSDEPGSAVAVNAVEWRLYNPRRNDYRTYVQSELTIEGEARLVGLARKVGAVLGDAGYSFGELGALLDDNATDWPKVLTLLEAVAASAPDLVADFLTVAFSIYPTDEDGAPNPAFEDHHKFLRGAVNLARLNDVLRTLMAQNEYARLVAPFSTTLSEAMDAYRRPPSASDSSAPSGEPVIVGTDGSPLQLAETTSPPTTEPQPSETETASEPSPV